MKIAIVCGHFLPKMGYIEVHLANAFHKIGHNVTVVTSNKIPKYVTKLGNINETNVPYNITRLKTDFSLGQMITSKKLIPIIKKINPQIVVTIGVGKLFPNPIYKIKNKTFKLVTLFGDNEETYTSKRAITKIKNILIRTCLKKPVYLNAIKTSNLLLPYTPSTISSITNFIDKKNTKTLLDKTQQISLGFDAEQFYYDEIERKTERKKLLHPHPVNHPLLITATRVAPEKKIEQIIDLVDSINEKGINLSYLIIGFQENTYCTQLKKYIATKNCKNNIICKPFSTPIQIRKYYNAADIAIFNRAAISIFEALSTGLFMLLPKQQNVHHILSKKNGIYFTKLSENDLIKAINAAKTNRLIRINEAKKFSYRILAQNIITWCEV